MVFEWRERQEKQLHFIQRNSRTTKSVGLRNLRTDFWFLSKFLEIIHKNFNLISSIQNATGLAVGKATADEVMGGMTGVSYHGEIPEITNAVYIFQIS